jgi:hypothetical protein
MSLRRTSSNASRPVGSECGQTVWVWVGGVGGNGDNNNMRGEQLGACAFRTLFLLYKERVY